MATPTVYALCGANCKYETLSREQILTAITQAVNEGTIGDVDTGFITTIKTINGTPLQFFVGSQAEYDALTDAQKHNLFAIITNDTTKQGINNAIEKLQTEVKDAYGLAANAHQRLDALDKSIPEILDRIDDVDDNLTDTNRYVDIVERRVYELEEGLTAIDTELYRDYAKLSSIYTQTGTASSGYPIWDFAKGTILTYRAIYSSSLRIGDIIQGGENGAITVHREYPIYAFNKGSDVGTFALISGNWRVCGICGSVTINSQQYNYWIIQRV